MVKREKLISITEGELVRVISGRSGSVLKKEDDPQQLVFDAPNDMPRGILLVGRGEDKTIVIARHYGLDEYELIDRGEIAVINGRFAGEYHKGAEGKNGQMFTVYDQLLREKGK